MRSFLFLVTILCGQFTTIAGKCTAVEVRQINKCLYALSKPDPDTATKEEKCTYATTYFRCFSGGCCKDTNFKDQIEFIKKDIEDMKCNTPVQCAGATAVHIHALTLMICGFVLVSFLF